jgi:hypothetical protein
MLGLLAMKDIMESETASIDEYPSTRQKESPLKPNVSSLTFEGLNKPDVSKSNQDDKTTSKKLAPDRSAPRICGHTSPLMVILDHLSIWIATKIFHQGQQVE